RTPRATWSSPARGVGSRRRSTRSSSSPARGARSGGSIRSPSSGKRSGWRTGRDRTPRPSAAGGSSTPTSTATGCATGRRCAGAIRYMEERLLPPGKRVRLFQWSGSTRVTEEAIAVLDRLGVPNINGGDTMRDREWPSYTHVAPLMRQVGRRWQTYTSASNENLYTHLWTGPFYGFRHVIETYENTERPRRVAPVNVYYHYYSGERVASLAALQYVHEWVLRQS